MCVYLLRVYCLKPGKQQSVVSSRPALLERGTVVDGERREHQNLPE